MSELTTPPSASPEPNASAPKSKHRLWWNLIRILGILILLPILIVQLPFVQDYISKQVVESMRDALGTDVELASVRIKWLDELSLNQLYVQDNYGDTLLLSGQVVADFNLNPFAIYSRGLEIEALSINGAQFNIRKHLGDSINNMQWALARLFPPKEQKTARRPLPLNLQELSLQDVSFTQNDSIRGSYLSIYLTTGHGWIDELDLANNRVVINSLNIQAPIINISNWHGTDQLSPIEILDSLASTTTKDGLALSIDEFRLESGQFRLHNYRKAPVKTTPDHQMDLKHLDVYDIQIEIDSFQHQRDTFQGIVNWIAAKERSGFALERLSSRKAFVCPTQTRLEGLSIVTPTSSLGDTIIFRYRAYEDWDYFDDRVAIDAKFNRAEVTLSDIMAFAPKLNTNRFFANNRNTNLRLDGRVRGRLNGSFRSKGISIGLPDGSFLQGKFSTGKLTTRGEEFAILELDRLQTRMRTLRDLFPNFNPPANFDKLGAIQFRGEFTGFFVDFVANGVLETDLGAARMDMQMVLTDGPDNATYSGNLALENFDLGSWTDNDQFGSINFSSEVKNGSGLTGDLATADLSAAITDFTFKGYTYQDANLTGRLNKNFFNGTLELQDDNIDFDFQGEVDLTDSIPAFDFKSQIRRLALQPLNLAKENIVLSGDADINIIDTKFSTIQGEVILDDIRISRYNTEEYIVDSVHAFSFFDQTGTKVFRLDSDLAKGEIKGAFNINDLGLTLKEFAVRNYPGFAQRLGITLPNRPPTVNAFSYDFHIADSKGLNRLIDSRLGPLSNIDLSGRYNGEADSLQLHLQVPSFSFGKVRLADVYIDLDALEQEGDLDIFVDSTLINDKRWLNSFTFISILSSDTLNFAMNVGTDSPALLDNVNLNGLFYLPDSLNFALQLKQSNLQLLKNPWTINENNRIVFGQQRIRAENVSLSHKDRRLVVNNLGERGLSFSLENFDFNFIDGLWDYDPLDFQGRFDLQLLINDVFNLETISTVASCDSFYINDDNFGRFDMTASVPDLKGQIAADIRFGNDSLKFQVDGKYNLADIGEKASNAKDYPREQRIDYLSLGIISENFPLNIAQYWLTTGLKNTYGTFDANLMVDGPTDKLDVDGYINAYDGGFTIEPLQTNYTFKRGVIDAGSYLFDLTGTEIYDKYGNVAYVNGGISHNHLRTLGLKATMSTRRFLGLDLEKGDNDLFYGQAVGSGQVTFSGDFQQPNIYVDATVEDSTHIYIPITDQAEKQELNFVKFVNKHIGSQTTDNSSIERLKGLNLEMDLRITEAADLEIIFDEKAGDILRGKGRGDLRILLPRGEDFQMYGDITVSQGNYLFTLYDVINKDFNIKPGGRLQWSGDPYNAQLNIQATYRDLKASLGSFLQEYLLNAEDDIKAQANQAVAVNLNLLLQGELFSPDIYFSLDFPSLQAGELKNLVDNKLGVLQRDQNEMNKQVFGLIVVGQFLPSDLSFDSDQVIFNTVSEYFSNQLSLLFDKLFGELIGEDRLDFDIAYRRYSTIGTVGEQDGPSTGDAVEFYVRSDFWNDRLNVQIGGNVEFGEGATAIYNGTFFGQDVAIEYDINKSGDLKIRLYGTRGPDIGGDERIEIGTGLSWRREYNSFKEFWQSFKSDARKTRDESN